MAYLLRVTLCVCLIGHVCAFAQNSESVLWQVTGNDNAKPSFIFGTVHIASKDLLDRFPGIMETANACDFAMFEKGGEEFSSARHAQIHTPALDSIFTEEEYALVDSFFTASPYGSIRPHNDEADLQAMAQVVLMLKQPQTAHQDSTFDDIINTRLRARNKRVFQLDETSEMANRAVGTNYRQIAEAVVWLIKNDYPETATPKELYDAEMYSRSLHNPMKLDQEAGNYIKSNTIARHALWIPKIETMMKQGSCFIAVGLAHLQYRTGLIELLRAKGFNVKEVQL